jgi:hypothetical protein
LFFRGGKYCGASYRPNIEKHIYILSNARKTSTCLNNVTALNLNLKIKVYVPPKYWHPPTILQNPNSHNVNICHENLKTYTTINMQKGSFMALPLKELGSIGTE